MNYEQGHLEYGDVIGVDLGCYQHFGIYLGDGQIIHYYPVEGNREKEVTIHIAKFDTFLGEEEEYFVCDFSKFYEEPKKAQEVVLPTKKLNRLLDPKLNLTEEFEKTNGIYLAFAMGRYKLYSPEETVKRAYSRLGEKSSDLIFDNCEFFCIWCKTGISDSYQTKALMKLLKRLWPIT